MFDFMYLLGTYMHVVAIIALLIKVLCTRDCTGISAKSQFLYALVFTTRYINLFTDFVSIMNTVCKLLFIAASYFILLSMIYIFRKTYEKEYDVAAMTTLIIPCMLTALMINHQFAFLDVLWAFSEYLETVAMVPQFLFILEAKRIDNYVIGYIFLMTMHMIFYAGQWAVYYQGVGNYDKLSVATAVVQIALNIDFLLQITHVVPDSEDDKQPTVATIEAGLPKSDHLAGDADTVGLTSASQSEFSKDEVNLLAAAGHQAIEKH